MIDSYLEKEIFKYNVSRETLDKLIHFSEILMEWNKKMNLVSKNSIQDVWQRHILDSLQLVDYIPREAGNIVDIGSGAGFPAIVLSIVLQERVKTQLTLVESITKKTVYLNDVAQKLGLKNVKVINSRVENTKLKDAEVITARAVAALDTLLGYQYKIGNNKTIGLYLKGKSYADELDAAKKKWIFACDEYENEYSQGGVILQISALRRKK